LHRYNEGKSAISAAGRAFAKAAKEGLVNTSLVGRRVTIEGLQVRLDTTFHGYDILRETV
jgi:hypothetical protein